MTKNFVTNEIREEAGKFQPVSDIVMFNLDHDRMGFCEACNHPIELHVGVYNPVCGYMWVGKCCKKILCASNAKMIVPDNGMQYQENDKTYVVISEEWVKKFYSLIYEDGKAYNKFGGYDVYKTYNWNSFTSSVYEQVKNSINYNGFYRLTVKQYEAINKLMG